MTTQTDYNENISPPTPGTIAGNRNRADVLTGICETAGPGGIPFGRAVSRGANSDQGVVLGGTVAGFQGCAVKEVTVPAGQGNLFLPPDNVGVLRGGDIWTDPNDAVAAGDAVWFHGTTGIFGKETGSGMVGPIKGALWKTSCGAGGVAIVSLPTVSQKSL